MNIHRRLICNSFKAESAQMSFSKHRVCSHTMEYYSAVKRNQTLKLAAWTNLQGKMLEKFQLTEVGFRSE